MSGVENRFNGKNYVTRYEVAQALRKLCSVVTVADSKGNNHLVPVDVEPFSRYFDDVAYVTTRRLMGVQSGKFNGNHFISRFEFASICARVARFFGLTPQKDVPLYFEDIKPGHWAEADIRYACSTGILNSRGVGTVADNVFAPQGKTEHISRFRRRRNSALGNFNSEFSRGESKPELDPLSPNIPVE
jgi:hypothetical protein